ncbi:hypothetical protein H671_5g14848 [Cricetulus griseus]|nr:hypothetical protein H671_5g14848 [Cricetulus griseus]
MSHDFINISVHVCSSHLCLSQADDQNFVHLSHNSVEPMEVSIDQFDYMVDYIDGFSYVEPSLHPWDEAYLIIVHDFSDVFLDSIHEYFVEYFCIDVHEEIGL